MKTKKQESHAASVFLMLCVCFFYAAQAQEVCDFYLTTCPTAFDGDTIHVPMRVIAMGPKVHGCAGDSAASAGSSPPSIVFVIDHSGSMTGTNDRQGSRFTVTRALLDTIYKTQPMAEVGLVVFRQHLFFDPRTSDYFSKYFVRLSSTVDNDGEPNQAYLPPMTLDSTYDGKKGIDILKDILATKDSISPGTTVSHVDLVYHPDFAATGSTNINVAFEGAKEAFANAKNPQARQFVLFFSDGDAQGTSQMGLPPGAFESGTDVPTTFTVYFTPDSTAPASLDSMTQHIRSNGYSITNPKSELWAIETSHATLLSLITNNIIGTLLAGSASSMIVSAITLSDTSTVYIDSYFVFSERFPLQQDITPFRLPLLYRYTDRGTGVVRDTVVTTSFFVKRDTGSVTLPADVAEECWSRTLQFTYGPNPITLVSDEMQPLGIRFSTNDPLAASVPVTLMSSIDTESVLMVKTGPAWTGSIMRYNTSSVSVRDGRLQHRNSDSIIAIFRNPKLPLDTVRIAIPFVNLRGPAVKTAAFFQGATPATDDTLRISFNEPINCQTLMSAPPESVFVYYDTSARSNQALQGATFLGSCTGQTVTEVRVLLRNSQFTVVPWEDSLAFVPGSPSVVDTSGAHPSATSIKRAIETGNQHVIELAASPNPASARTPIDQQIAPQIRQAYAAVIGSETYGTLISIYSNVPLKQISVGGITAYGKAEIYDAVGNLVRTELPVVVEDKAAGIYGVFWNLRNRNSRLVGGGTYLVMVFTTDITGKSTVRRIKVGVQR